MNKKTMLFLALFFFVGSVALFAFDGYVEITNDTGFTIYYVYVSHEDSSSWEEDMLGSDVLMDGDSIRVDLEGYPSSVFDIMVEDEDGDTYTFWGVDVAYEDLTVTIMDLDL